MPHRVKVRATKATRGKLAFPTRESWVRHVAISGGAVARIPTGPNAGKLGARYGGPGTRYPRMAVRYDVAPANIRALDALARHSDDVDVLLDRPRELLMHDYGPALDRVAKDAFGKAVEAVKDSGFPAWLVPAVGVALVAYAVNTFLPRHR